MVPVIQSPTIYDAHATEEFELSHRHERFTASELNAKSFVPPERGETVFDSFKFRPGLRRSRVAAIGNEVLKATVAQYNADELLTRRQEVTEQIAKSLRRRAEDFGILLDDVALTHLSFSHEYSRVYRGLSRWRSKTRRGQSLSS